MKGRKITPAKFTHIPASTLTTRDIEPLLWFLNEVRKSNFRGGTCTYIVEPWIKQVRNCDLEQYEEFVTALKNKELQDFAIPAIDPSIDEEDNLFYQAGNEPAVGKSYNWWNEKAQTVMEGYSRLGTPIEYISFLMVMYKKIKKEYQKIGFRPEEVEAKSRTQLFIETSSRLGAWYSLCLGKTGTCPFAGFSDLANTWKILQGDDKNFFIASGCCFDLGKAYPLGRIEKRSRVDAKNSYGVGWIVIQ